MRKILSLMEFKIGEEIVASLELENNTISEAEELKTNLAIKHNVFPEDIEITFTKKEVFEPTSDLFISFTGKLCFYNDMWNVVIVNGMSMVDWVDLTTEEGINTLSDYKFIGKADELIKFN
jgi:ABC-type maltose transport system permease subunit